MRPKLQGLLQQGLQSIRRMYDQMQIVISKAL
jgi:hypothetical protein